MANVRFMLCLVLLLQTHQSLQDCRIIQVSPNVPNYHCNTIDEVERLENPDLLNVSIIRDDIDSRIATAQKKPNLQVVLLEVADLSSNSFSPSTIQALKNLSQSLKNGPLPVDTLPANFLANLPVQKVILEDTNINKLEQDAFARIRDVEEIRLVHNKLKIVPTGVFNNLPVEILALSNNAIEFIERNALSNMQKLKELYLDGNFLTEFQPENFMTHRKGLEVLWLNNNLFEVLDGNFLRQFESLRELNLNNNKISKILSYTFEYTPDLERLYLSDNMLLQLNPKAFPDSGMPKLTRLYINNNRLSSLSNNLLGRLTKLRYIRVVGNPWQCPCFDAILRWLSDYGVQQVCDKDYYSGTRPICVMNEFQPTFCDYNVQEFLYYRYNEVNSKARPSPKCEL